MKLICDYCGNYMEETEEKCPHCGAVNPQYKRIANEVPHTIYELKMWYMAHNLPPEEVTRFFIGKDVKEARAFGIYEESGRFIVYKNKADGTRAVRYDGADEAYAVHEIYLKLKEEISKQKAANAQKRANASAGQGKASLGNGSRKSGAARTTTELAQKDQKAYKRKKRLRNFIIGIAVFLILSVAAWADDEGYYRYKGNYYYQYENEWYVYDEENSYWTTTEIDEEFENNYRDYYDGYTYQEDYSISNFKKSIYYEDYGSSSDSYSDSWSYDDDSWDSDSSWDDDSSWDSYDSWDSGSSDWDSDW